jgi:hypothetical protein
MWQRVEGVPFPGFNQKHLFAWPHRFFKTGINLNAESLIAFSRKELLEAFFKGFNVLFVFFAVR